ncbi:DUF11 domain-containing protein [Leucothrix sargassi]|nr:DUF11 domain-containing protein [Leucothrix sargassi]
MKNKIIGHCLSVVVLTAALSSASALAAGPTFECDGTPYPTFGSNPTTLQRMDRVTLAVTDIATVSPSGTINATGYNILDNYIYGLQGRNFFQLSADGTYILLGQPVGVGASTGVAWNIGVTFAGTMDASGNWYGLDNDYIYIVSIGSNPASGSLTFERFARSGSFTGRLADLAFNPLDGHIYGMSSGNLRQVTTSGVSSTVTVSGSGLSGSAGGAWSTSSGILYFYNNGAGQLYSVDMTKAVPEATFVGNVERNGTFDATACTPPVVGKAVSPNTVAAGQPFTYTFTLVNPLSTDISVDFTDIVPAGMSFVSNSLSTTSPGGGSVSTFNDTTLIIDNIVIPSGLPPNNQITFTAQAVADDVASVSELENQAQITFGVNTVISNDPDTTDIDDATAITVNPSDRGDAPASMTSIDASLTSTYGEAWHMMDSAVRLGSLIDGDFSPQNSGLNADGDDNDGSNDDDGVTFPLAGTTPILRVDEDNVVTVNASVNGYLNAWIDWNQDGDWDDAGETVATNSPLNAGNNTLTLKPSVTSPHGATYIRFRFTSDSVSSPSAVGFMEDGEVEDYKVNIALATPVDVCTSAIINTGFESGPNPTTFIQPAEDLVEGWATIPDSPNSSNSYQRRNAIEIWRSGFLGVPAYDGTYFAELNAHVPGMLYQDVELIPGSRYTWSFAHRARTGINTLNVLMGEPDSMVLQGTYSSDTSAWQTYVGTYVVPAGQFITRFGFQAVGSASVGNFLDSAKIPGGCDFGDAPSSYATELSNNAAHHVSNSLLFLGDIIGDAESDGQPDASALSDDTSGVSDEDGISSFEALTVANTTYGLDVTVNNLTGEEAKLIAWIDFDRSGTFDSDEAAIRTVQTGAVSESISLNWSAIPRDIEEGLSYVRVRITTEAMTSRDAGGIKENGEVEDYAIAILDTSVSGRVFIDTNSDTQIDMNEVGLGGTVVVLHNTNTGVCRSVETDGSGYYKFSGVLDGSYEVYQAHRETTPVPQNCGTTFAQNPVGYQSTTADVLPVVVNNGVDVTDQNFGEVAGAYSDTDGYHGYGIVFEPNNQGEVLPGNVAFYRHTFITQADGDVSFNGVGAGNVNTAWSHLLYHDADCNGSLDDMELATTVETNSFTVSAGDRVCLVNKVFAPANVDAGDQFNVTTVATFNYAGAGLAPIVLSVNDLTIAAQASSTGNAASRLALRKSVQNVTQSTPETGTLNQAKPGDTLHYRIYYRNTGVGPITDLEVNDSVPDYTSLLVGSTSCDTTPSTLTCVPIEANDVSWDFTGVLEGGQQGEVSYQVVVDQ